MRISDWSSDVCSSDLILVNNAGVATTKSALDVSETEWDQVVDTNLKGAWLMAQAVAGHMVRLGHGGSIVNMASVLGLAAAAQIPAYCASKGGLVTLARALAVAWRSEEHTSQLPSLMCNSYSFFCL